MGVALVTVDLSRGLADGCVAEGLKSGSGIAPSTKPSSACWWNPIHSPSRSWPTHCCGWVCPSPNPARSKTRTNLRIRSHGPRSQQCPTRAQRPPRSADRHPGVRAATAMPDRRCGTRRRQRGVRRSTPARQHRGATQRARPRGGRGDRPARLPSRATHRRRVRGQPTLAAHSHTPATPRPLNSTQSTRTSLTTRQVFIARGRTDGQAGAGVPAVER